VTSDRKLSANQRNAAKSTGPKSVTGKQRSRRNALSHGLAVPASADPALSDDISALARIIALASGKDDVTESARIAAEAQVYIFRIRKVRSSIYDRLSRSPLQEADHTKLSKCLASLERYERRAFSRQKQALRDISQTGYDTLHKYLYRYNNLKLWSASAILA
jgi:hypothetical protein